MKPGPTFTAVQNCNSLNLTTNVRSFDLKTAAIKGFGTDIILLCDTRLVSNKGINGTNRIKNAFRDKKGKKYDVYANSSKNSRGVAILIDTSLNLQPEESYSDPEENFLVIKLTIKGIPFLIGSIYGPNSTGRDFFRRLGLILERNKDCKIIIGGDWNTVWDTSMPESNIDLYNMQNIPNKCNRDLLREMARNFSLFDPTRVLYPDKKIYTYSPFGNMRKNRSRLDFFLLSGELLPALAECKPSIISATNLFDHRMVALSMGGGQ